MGFSSQSHEKHCRNSWRTIITYMVYQKYRTHLLATTISCIYGCQYCIYGHALSFQLHYFDKKGKLFPIDEKEMMLLSEKNENEIVQILNDAFDSTGLVKEKEDLKRLMELMKNIELVQKEDDQRINHLIEMFSFLNSCGIEKQTAPDFAHDPIQKNRKLHQQYINRKDRKLTHAFEKTLASLTLNTPPPTA